MKYGFSTLGCPTWGFKEIFTSAKDLGYSGVEIRGISEELFAPNVKYFNDENIEETLNFVKGLCIEIPILSSVAQLAQEGKQDEAMVEVEAYIKLAARLKTPYIRVLCTNSLAPNGGDYNLLLDNYKKAVALGEKAGVTPLIETNGMLADTALMKKLMESVDSSNKGVLWDINHPYRYNNESIDMTIENIGRYVKYVHIKDSVIDNGNVNYKMVGYGDIPIRDAIVRLNNLGYTGYLTLEWLKRWDMQLEESGVAFCHYIGYIKTI